MQIDTLVPTTLRAAGGWTSQEDCVTPSAFGTLVGVTSDGNDDTFARLDTGGGLSTATLSFSLGNHTPPADHERHMIRISARWVRTGSPVPSVGVNVRMRGARVNTSPQGYFLFADITTNISGSQCVVNDRASAYSPDGVVGGGTVEFLYFVNRAALDPTLSAAELEMDIDCRDKPVFTAQVLDGAGTTTTPITDTTTPTFAFDSIDFDGLNGRSWRIFLYTLAETMVGGFAPFDPNFTTVNEFEGNGPPPSSIPGEPIPNGDYVAYFEAYSTIRANSEFASDIESVAFEMDFTPPDPPDLVVTYDSTDDLVEVCFSSVSPGSPGEPAFDAGVVVTEIQRSDCDGNGFETVAVIESQDDCWDDCIFPYANTGTCAIPEHECVLTYRVRYWGLVDGILIATDWSTEDTAEVVYPYGENDRLRTIGCVTAVICPDRSWSRTRPFGAFQPIGGGLPTVVTGAPGGRDFTLTFPVSDIDPSLPDLADIEAVLAEMVVHYAPTDLPAQWMAPDTESIEVVKVGRLRSYSVSFVATGPPVVATPESFFPDE